jgi:hypothetical protein
MKHLKFLFLLLAFSTNLTAQSLVDGLFFSNPENYYFKGTVKKIKEISFHCTSETEKLIDTIDCPKYLEFDKNGRITRSKYCYFMLYFDYEYKYNMHGKLIKKFNSNSSDEFMYDNRNNLLEKKHGIVENDFFGSWAYRYDEENNQIERIGYIGDSFVERWKHIYNENNIRIKELMVDEDVDTVIYIMRHFEYDMNKNIIRQQYVSYQGNKGEWNDFFKYNENNDRIEWKRVDNEGHEEKEKYKYKYDNESNWIERKTYRNNQLIELTKREIEYWEKNSH